MTRTPDPSVTIKGIVLESVRGVPFDGKACRRLDNLDKGGGCRLLPDVEPDDPLGQGATRRRSPLRRTPVDRARRPVHPTRLPEQRCGRPRAAPDSAWRG